MQARRSRAREAVKAVFKHRNAIWGHFYIADVLKESRQGLESGMRSQTATMKGVEG
jgi:hypothetical protein